MTKQDYTFRYRVRDWSAYNRVPINRGRLTLWFDKDAVSAWRNTSPSAAQRQAVYWRVLTTSDIDDYVNFWPLMPAIF